TGQITVDVATASKDFGFASEYWVIDRWFEVLPRDCKVVFSHSYSKQSWLHFRSYPLHLAFAFTDSTGVWGAAKVAPPSGTAASHLRLCVRKDNWKYRVDGADPATACEREPKSFLIPASIDWEPTEGTQVCNYYSSRDCQSIAPEFTVALGPNDRAIALGPQASPGAASQGPGKIQDLDPILTDAVRGPGAPTPHISGRDFPITNFFLQVCVAPPAVEKAPWTDPQSARSQAIKAAIRQFMASHRFPDAGDAAEKIHDDAATGLVSRTIRVTETRDNFSVNAVRPPATGDEVDCPGDATVDMRVPAAAQSATKPPPTAKPANQPSPGFGDLISPGIITPPR
ncbi:MAG: hypothetical protein ACRETD_00075, partial [Steroidobacteraceae bacterium]